MHTPLVHKEFRAAEIGISSTSTQTFRAAEIGNSSAQTFGGDIRENVDFQRGTILLHYQFSRGDLRESVDFQIENIRSHYQFSKNLLFGEN